VRSLRSENEYGSAAEREMADKRADYLAAGTLVVWDVDVLRERVVRVYRAGEPDRPTVYRSGDVAEAEPASPGWTMPVDDLPP
jgi:Uma2 family endonuclease